MNYFYPWLKKEMFMVNDVIMKSMEKVVKIELNLCINY